MGVSVKSIRNHISLIIALVSILFSLQLFVVVERSMDAYKKNLANNYAVIVVSKKEMSSEDFIAISKIVASATELSADSIVNRLSSDMKNANIDLLKLSLPRFYKLTLSYYPTPKEVEALKELLLKNANITKIEDFSHNHDIIYKLLLLFKNVVSMFAVVIIIVTVLLIFKELKIWQYKHNERMSIMALFGAPVWLRSGVLFRLSIVDAIISSIITILVFVYLSSHYYVVEQFKSIGIEVIVFDVLNDSLVILGVAHSISILLAILIIIGHKEEV